MNAEQIKLLKDFINLVSNYSDIKWMIIGSLSLKLHGIQTPVRDIDILISDSMKLRDLRILYSQNSDYETEHLENRLLIPGTLAFKAIYKNNTILEFLFESLSYDSFDRIEYGNLNDLKNIPIIALPDMKEMYKRINRLHKIKLIDEFFKDKTKYMSNRERKIQEMRLIKEREQNESLRYTQ